MSMSHLESCGLITICLLIGSARSGSAARCGILYHLNREWHAASSLQARWILDAIRDSQYAVVGSSKYTCKQESRTVQYSVVGSFRFINHTAYSRSLLKLQRRLDKRQLMTLRTRACKLCTIITALLITSKNLCVYRGARGPSAHGDSLFADTSQDNMTQN